MKLYKKQPDHAKQKVGTSDLEGFFAWALKLCRRDKTDRVMVETPDWRITWDAPRKPLKKRIKRKAKASKERK